MATRPSAAEIGALLRRAPRPPVAEGRFWAIQAMVVVLAGLHLLVDLRTSEIGAFPGGIPVALLVIPVGYAALRYGLAGSVATGLWATLLWLPDLLLPNDQGHVGGDVINLVLINGIALFLGWHVDAERLARDRVERATADRLKVEARYRELFEANDAPILVLDARGIVREANPAARALLGDGAVGARAGSLLGGPAASAAEARVLELADGRHYRVRLGALPAGGDGPAAQVILEDVTEERRSGRRATRYAALVVAAEEDQRRRLARELHDEPLQLFLHLARRLEDLGRAPGVPGGVAAGLGQARVQALEAAARLRGLAKDLRPPALDQLGLVAALSSFLADVDEETGIAVDLDVVGTPARLASEVELGAFRIVQEAVRNTLRHSGAEKVRVGVAFRPDELEIEVTDDGTGFVRQPGAELATRHLGLLGMTERANLLGGILDVRSGPGAGTSVVAALPRDARESDVLA